MGDSFPHTDGVWGSAPFRYDTLILYRNSAENKRGKKLPIEIDENLPVQVYFIDLNKAYLRYIRWQWHDELEVVIVNHGEADVMTNGKMFHLKPGQGIFINRGVLHSILPYGENSNCTLYSLTFDPSYLLARRGLAATYLEPFIDSPSLKAVFLEEAEPFGAEMLDLVNDVIAANAMKPYAHEIVMRTRLYQLWLLMLEKVEETTVTEDGEPVLPPVTSQDEVRVKEAIHYIEENFAAPITLDSLAAAIFISKGECCRCFKRTIKMTPIEYVMRFRIYAAAKIISENESDSLSISDLAFSVGFNNVSYFNKTFKKYLDQTPTEYRNALKYEAAADSGAIVMMR
jgi:AraC-like DNA-binding protein/mannose-6-phosphate isomerase-like protein (cupin superfamily)